MKWGKQEKAGTLEGKLELISMDRDLCQFLTDSIPPTSIMRMSCRLLAFFVTELNMHLALGSEKLEELWAWLLLHGNQMTQQTNDTIHELQLCLMPCTDFLGIKEHGRSFMATCQFLSKVSHANLELYKEGNSG